MPSQDCFTMGIIKRRKSGIYKITAPNGKFYIGSSIDIRNRGLSHRSRLKHGKHPNQKVVNSFNKYGSLHFEPVLFCDIDKLEEMEQLLIDGLKPELNILQEAYHSYGYKHSKEAIIKMEEIAKKRSKSPSWKELVSDTWFKKGSKKIPSSIPIEKVSHLAHEITRRKVLVTHIETGKDIIFNSVIDASNYVGGPNRCCVSHRLSGRLKNKYKGYRFSYAI